MSSAVKGNGTLCWLNRLFVRLSFWKMSFRFKRQRWLSFRFSSFILICKIIDLSQRQSASIRCDEVNSLTLKPNHLTNLATKSIIWPDSTYPIPLCPNLTALPLDVKHWSSHWKHIYSSTAVMKVRPFYALQKQQYTRLNQPPMCHQSTVKWLLFPFSRIFIARIHAHELFVLVAFSERTGPHFHGCIIYFDLSGTCGNEWRLNI